MTSHNANIRAHSAFIAVAAILSLMSLPACSSPADATPGEAAPKPATYVAAASAIEAGRYLVKIGGCNDCHTPGYVISNGAAPAEADWLTGESVGFSGPWGVSYPANLRLSFQNMDEEQFLDMAHAGKGRPPMPWPSLKAMSDDDLKAIYAYIRSLGPKGDVAPAPLSPGVAPDRPHIAFVPQMPAIPTK
jgi:mono/diheme cytochrome c family protein